MRHLLASLMALAVVPGLVTAAEPAKAAPANTWLGILAAPRPDTDKPGAMIQEVMPDSPAAKAGLKAGDIILKADAKDMKDAEAFVQCVKAHHPGDKLALQLLRDGKEQTMSVTLAERPAPKREAFLGVFSAPLSPEMKEHLGVTMDKGAVVMMVMPDSPAAKAGLKRDDVITGVDDQAISTPAELRAAVQKAGADKDVTLKIVRGKETKEVKAHLEAGRHHVGLSPEMEKHFQEMQKHLRELEDRFEVPAK